MNILDLRRVDEDAPMVCEVRHTPDGVGYTIEPGDITRYTVLVSGNVALAFVGLRADDYNVWLVRRGWNNYHPEKLNPYNLAVLAYFAASALGQDVPEPDVLASRRKPVHRDDDLVSQLTEIRDSVQRNTQFVARLAVTLIKEKKQ